MVFCLSRNSVVRRSGSDKTGSSQHQNIFIH
jgi:hypothetical protein